MSGILQTSKEESEWLYILIKKPDVQDSCKHFSFQFSIRKKTNAPDFQ